VSQTDSSGEIDLCRICGRVKPALSAHEYTSRRAELIIERGMCVCGNAGHGNSKLGPDVQPHPLAVR
jgi:hypothetical protein